MPSAQDIAKQSGLNPVHCGSCNNKIKTNDSLDSFFKILLEEVKSGKRVTIPGLGTFSMRLHKGREITSSILPGGRAVSADKNVLRFRPSGSVRAVLNPNEVLEAPQKTAKEVKKPAAKKPAAKKAEAEEEKTSDDVAA